MRRKSFIRTVIIGVVAAVAGLIIWAAVKGFRVKDR